MRKRVVCLLFVCFALTFAESQTYTDLHDFVCATDGCGPANAVLVQAQDGNLYGTTGYGGTYNQGTAFKITPAGSFSVIYNFADQTTGMSPQGGVVLGQDGNLYGTTSLGGPTNGGTVFKITPSGTLTTLYAFDFYAGTGSRPDVPLLFANDGSFYGLSNPSAAFKVSPSGTYKALTTALPASPSWAGLIQARNGNFYSTTYSGGANNSGTIFQMTPAGAVKVIYNFDTVHGGWGYAPLVEDSQGYLYGTEAQGGSAGGGVVFREGTGGALKVLHNFVHQDTSGGWNVAAGLVLGNDGNLYGSTSAGGAPGYGVLYKISRTGTYQQLYEFDRTHGGWPTATAMQHTNGKIYGLAAGGAYGTAVVWSLDVGLSPFIKLMSRQGKAGQAVGILGQGFTGASSVRFGSSAAAFTVLSDTYMTAVVPASGISGAVTVTTPSKTLTSNTAFKVIPTLTAFSPTSGIVGTSVVLTGTGLTETTRVTFGGVKAAFTVNSGTQVTATVPLTANTGKIVVTTTGGTASKGTFTVNLPAITGLLVEGVPSNTAPIGSTLTIQGRGFGATVGFNMATLNGIPIAGGGVKPVSWSDTRIDAIIPNTACSGPVVVSVRALGDSNSWNLIVPVVITGVTPSSVLAGNSITILGRGFGTLGGAVSFNGTNSSVTGWTESDIVAQVPLAATAGPIVVTVSGYASNGFPFTPTPLIKSLLPSSGPAGTFVTISGNSFGNQQGTNTVTFKGVTAMTNSWTNTHIVAIAPTEGQTGNVVVTVNGVQSAGQLFTYIP